MAEPLVSIIIPVYNAATHVAKCIETVRRQTYRNIEILLVNDGSSDASGPICHMYARVDDRVRVIDKENTGVSATRNLALDLAKGDYIQFADSDDYLRTNATELLVECAEKTKADLVVAAYYRVSRGKTVAFSFLPDGVVMNQEEFARELMEEPASFYYGVLWNKLYRADIIRENGIRCNTELSWSEDFLFNLEYIRYAQRFCGIDTPIYYYINNKGSLVHTQLNLPNIVRTRTKLFTYYRDLYERLGLYEQYKLQIHKYLISIAEHV